MASWNQPIEGIPQHIAMGTARSRIRWLEENVTEERQCGLPSLPARDPSFPQPSIYLAPKSSSNRNRTLDGPSLIQSDLQQLT